MLVSQTPLTTYLDQWSSPIFYCPQIPIISIDLTSPSISEFELDDCEFVS